MELLVAISIGAMTAAGVYLMLRLRTFPVVLGLSMLSYAVNVFIFASGRLVIDAPPVIGAADTMTDPLPQALVLTAIVISFGMTALVVILSLSSYLNAGTDVINIEKPGEQPETGR
jgi:multicomponent K+:H+ antiporter subunit C